MKKGIWLTLIFMIGIVLGACNTNSSEEGQSQRENVFTEEDIVNADEMINFLNERMNELEIQANESIENGEIVIGDNGKLLEEVQLLGQKIVVQPFLEKYPNGLIPRTVGDNFIPITVEGQGEDSCNFGNCIYEEVSVLNLAYEIEPHNTYFSEVFEVSQLIFEDVTTSSRKAVENELKKGEIRFVKSIEGDLILTSIPYIQIQNLYVEELDSEYESIQTSVPESEVETEQAEYKAEVEETLSKFPELQ